MRVKLKFIILLFLPLFWACKKDKSREITVITVEEVREAIDDNIQLVDVRTIEEFSEGHLINAKNICVTDDDFEEKASKLDKNAPVYLYCRSGKRSARAAEILQKMGFTEIYDIEGGFLKWEENDYEVSP